jgi:O-glycosyl hydrolase
MILPLLFALLVPAPPLAAQDGGAVRVFLSSELHPQDAAWFKKPWPESQWRYKLSEQAPLPLTPKDAASALATVNVDPGKTYQTVLGMGTSLEETSVYAMAKNHDDKQIREILRSLIDPATGIGMSLFRLAFGTSDFSDGRAVSRQPQGFYSYQDDPRAAFSIENDRKLDIIRVARLAVAAAKESGQTIRFFASAWSPPGWMKDSGSLIGGKLKTDMIPAYAAYLRKAVQAYEAEGIPIYAVTTNNEHYYMPAQYPGCFFDAGQEKLLVEALGREFRQAGLKTRIWLFDHNFDAWREPAKSLAGLKAASAQSYAFADGVAFHHYAGQPADMTRLHERFPDKSLQFSEGSEWGVKGAAEIVEILRNWSSSYVSWVTMATQTPEEHIQGPFDKAGKLGPLLLIKDDGAGPGWHKIPEYYLYGQFMRFIRPGALRIASDPGSQKTATDVAFKNPDGGIVIVAVNQNAQAQDLRFVIDGKQFTASIPPAVVATYVLAPGSPR